MVSCGFSFRQIVNVEAGANVQSDAATSRWLISKCRSANGDMLIHTEDTEPVGLLQLLSSAGGESVASWDCCDPKGESTHGLQFFWETISKGSVMKL